MPALIENEIAVIVARPEMRDIAFGEQLAIGEHPRVVDFRQRSWQRLATSSSRRPMQQGRGRGRPLSRYSWGLKENHFRHAFDSKKRPPGAVFSIFNSTTSHIAKYKHALRKHIIKSISGTAQTIIESAQPYHATQPRDDPLAILQDLNNIDKHRLLLVVSSYTYVPDTIRFSGDKIENGELTIIPENWSRRMVRAVEGGAELFSARFHRPVKVDMYAQFAPQIAFEKFGLRQDEPIIPGLTSLRDAVVKTIKLFATEF
jgi:hypothetical protein